MSKNTTETDFKVAYRASGKLGFGVQVKRSPSGTVVSLADGLGIPLYYFPEKHLDKLAELFKATAEFAVRVLPKGHSVGFSDFHVGPIPDALADVITPKVLAILRRAVRAWERQGA